MLTSDADPFLGDALLGWMKTLMKRPKKKLSCRTGFTLTELVVTISVIAIFLFLTQFTMFRLIDKYRFKARIQDFVSTLQMAAVKAAESPSRYEVIIDPIEQTYLLREITTPHLDEVLQEEIIAEGDFGNDCRVDYIQFDDGETTSGDPAKFRAGHAGWNYGGKIVFVDAQENQFSVVLNRLNRLVELEEGDVELWMPKDPEDMLF
jgi:prepilin-type N-terminal cleavage/methylation domain-containing protein